MSRAVGVALLSLLAAAPVVRALCIWDCELPRPAASQEGHCAQPATDPAHRAGASANGECSSCEALNEAPRATVRPEAAPMLLMARAGEAAETARVAARQPLAPVSASPPLLRLFPLRI